MSVDSPVGWSRIPIGDLVGGSGVFADGDWVESKDQDPEGSVRLIQLADVGDGEFRDRSNRFMNEEAAERLNCTYLSAGDVLIARMPDPLGRACQLPSHTVDEQPCVTVVDVCIVRPGGPNGVSAAWLTHAVNAPELREAMAQLQKGTTRKRISRKNLGTIELPVPPLPEQGRIVAKLQDLFSDLDAGTQALDQAQAKLERYRASVLKAAVEGKLTEQWRKENPVQETGQELLDRILVERRFRWEEEQLAKYDAKGKKLPKNWQARYKEPVGPDTSDLPGLPEGWCWATVEELTDGRRSTAYGVLQPGPDLADGVPLIRVGNVEGGLVHGRLKRIASEIAEKYPRTRLRGGEVLLTLVGAIGRTAVVPASMAGSNTARAVGVIPLSPLLKPSWVEVWFRSPVQRSRMALKAHEVARKTLNLEDVRSAPVAIPPLSEQEVILLAVESVEQTSRRVSAWTATSNRIGGSLRRSILKRAFEGRLVPQDPDDEPASVLLERIKAQREAEPKKKRRTKKKTSQPELDL